MSASFTAFESRFNGYNHFMNRAFQKKSININLSTLLAALLMSFLSSFVSSPANAEVVRLAVGEWPPYISQKLKHNGLSSHIITEAFSNVGIEVRYDFLPWARAMKEASVGNSNGTHSLFYSEERAKHFLFSDPVLNSEYVFFYLKLRPFDWRQFEDLKGMTIGVTYGYFYGDEFSRSQQQGVFQTSKVPDDKQNLKMLLRKRVDLVPIDPLVGYHLIHQMFMPQQTRLFTNHPRAFNSQPTYLLLSKEYPRSEALIKLFNQGLKQLNDSGRLDELVDDFISGKYY